VVLQGVEGMHWTIGIWHDWLAGWLDCSDVLEFLAYIWLWNFTRVRANGYNLVILGSEE
jgi:hypothetical protein